MSNWKTELKQQLCFSVGALSTGIASVLALDFLRGAISNWLNFKNNEFYAYYILTITLILSPLGIYVFSAAQKRGKTWGLKLIRYGWPLTFFVFFTNPSDHVGPVFFTLTALVVLGLWRVSYLCLCRVLAGYDERRD